VSLAGGPQLRRPRKTFIAFNRKFITSSARDSQGNINCGKHQMDSNVVDQATLIEIQMLSRQFPKAGDKNCVSDLAVRPFGAACVFFSFVVQFCHGYHSDLVKRLYGLSLDWSEEVQIEGSAACNDETVSKYFPSYLTVVRLLLASLSSDDHAWNAVYVRRT
jgi:hypothetical protein